MNSVHDITTAQLREMIQLKERIEFLQGLLSSLRAPSTKRKMGRSKGTTRAKMAAGKKAKWAKKGTKN